VRSRTRRPQYAHTRRHPVAAPAAQHQHLDSRLPFGQGRSFFGGPVMQAAASLSVTSSRPGVGKRQGLLPALDVLLTSS
jgi:hypothetical protein